MNRKYILHIGVVLILLSGLLLTACEGGGTSSESDASAPSTQSSAAADSEETSKSTDAEESTSSSASSEDEDEEVESEPEVPQATPEPKDLFPDLLVIHPDAYDFEVTEATNTYVYVVPMMVAETMEYLEAELTAKGWEELGKPTVMGHLATLNLTRENARLNISMQDNERSQTTRVQMLLSK